ncbi:MAG: adenine deaminase [Synergistaceae bacterium]|nr:adenine deaminase [Synergistaceae bacterium]
MKLASVARGDIPADIVIRNARVANIFTQSYELADIAVYSGKIAGIGTGYNGNVSFDAEGRAVIPGMIDGHIHIEDTMMTPANFASIAARHGTSAVMADPHEISNALGIAGLEYMFMASQGLPVDIFYGAPSCVPASDLETPYEELDMTAMKSMFDRGMTQHLGEMMNFPAVIAGDAEAWGKILAAGNVPLTGHAPGVTGKELCAYMSSGINSDHECTTLDEAREKLSRGMWLMIREGATFLDLKTLLPLIRENPLNAARCMAVSDDITARYLLERGHMDEKMRIMLREDINPFTALRMVTLSPAEYFRLYDRGIIAPGKIADFVILDDEAMTEDFGIHSVWKNGRQIVRDDDVFAAVDAEYLAPVTHTKVRKVPTADNIRVKAEGRIINAIGVTQGTVITRTLQVPAKVVDGFAAADGDNDLAKIVVLERHRDTGRFGVGFVRGLGIKRGAIGSSVAHDAHNFVVAGTDDTSIAAALKSLADMGGGLVVADGEEVKASFALPIGGLMSYLSPEKVADSLANMENAATELGVKIPHPFMVLSFLCLSVIPELRITDLGLVDITKGGKQPLFVR